MSYNILILQKKKITLTADFVRPLSIKVTLLTRGNESVNSQISVTLVPSVATVLPAILMFVGTEKTHNLKLVIDNNTQIIFFFNDKSSK